MLRTKSKIALGICALIVLGGLGAGGYYWAKHKNKDTPASTNSTALYLNPQSDPQTVLSQNLPAPVPSAVLGVQTGNGSIASGIGVQIITNQNLQFTLEIPRDWTVVEKPNEAVITSPASIQYSIQMYPSPSDDMAALKTYLSTRSNLHNITDSFAAGRRVWSFVMDGVYKHGVAFLEHGKLYYLLGPDIENSQITQSFKTF